MIEKTYNVGIYCRLNNEDERDGESVSIENQKLLLQSYVLQRGWNEICLLYTSCPPAASPLPPIRSSRHGK